jgi:hypothetical protein
MWGCASYKQYSYQQYAEKMLAPNLKKVSGHCTPLRLLFENRRAVMVERMYPIVLVSSIERNNQETNVRLPLFGSLSCSTNT